ncbi:MAG: PaaI family thioesterase [Clostridia bacterium]|nr:PaaI family thioesterase [Clostridia bacterium]
MRIIKAQKNSKDCIICGMENSLGVQAPFFELQDGRIASVFQFKKEHQSYPGRVHGGMITAMLDELAGRVLWITQPDIYAVTTSLEVKFHKPVPYNVDLKAVGEISVDTRRAYEAKAKIMDMDGVVLASAVVKYFKMDKSLIASEDMDEQMIYDIDTKIEDIDV